jgi:hypothetical protein
LLVPSGNGVSPLGLFAARHPIALTAVNSALLAVWVLVASTFLFWAFPIAILGSIVIGWLLSRKAAVRPHANFVLFALPTALVVWAWLAITPDRNYGRIAHWFATAHVAIVFVVFNLAQIIKRERASAVGRPDT